MLLLVLPVFASEARGQVVRRLYGEGQAAPTGKVLLAQLIQLGRQPLDQPEVGGRVAPQALTEAACLQVQRGGLRQRQRQRAGRSGRGGGLRHDGVSSGQGATSVAPASDGGRALARWTSMTM
jgi:hypothetical protein